MGLNRTLATKEREADGTATCPLCAHMYTEQEMVQCDVCNLWVHYACAGVDDDVAEAEIWVCAVCMRKEEEARKAQNLPSSSKSKSVKDGLQKAMSVKSGSSRAARQERRELLKAALDNSNAKVKELERQASIIAELSAINENESSADSVVNENQLIDLLDPSQRHSTPLVDPGRVPNNSLDVNLGSANRPNQAGTLQNNLISGAVQGGGRRNTASLSVNQPNASIRGDHTNIVPSAAQLSARHTIGKELPSFSGNPVEWPVFISSFRETTMACGFSATENLVRLQKCLKDPARKMVQGLLTRADHVPLIIETLHNLYGQPERVIENMIREIKSMPAPNESQLDTVVKYCIEVYNLSLMLTDENLENYRKDPSLVHTLLAKLPSNIQILWSNADVPTGDVVEFGRWLHSFGMSLCKRVPSGLAKLENSKKQKVPVGVHNEIVEEGSKSCPVCDKSCTSVSECSDFKKLAVPKRLEEAKNLKLCFRCLKRHSFQKPCKHPVKCDVSSCMRKHHPLLHSVENSVPTVEPKKEAKSPEKASLNFTQSDRQDGVRFRYIPVTLVKGKKTIETHAFLDEGSTTTLLNRNLAKRLGVRGTIKPLSLAWTDESVCRTEENSEEVEVQVLVGTKKLNLKARTISELHLPMQSLDYEALSNRYTHLQNLPIESYHDVTPEILIGLDNWNLALPLKVKEGEMNQPIAVKCRLAWTIFAMTNSSDGSSINVHQCDCSPNHSDDDLYELVKRFYTVDRLGIRPTTNSSESQEDRRAREIMQSTLKRNGQRFEIGLLWRTDHVVLPNSKPMAERRFYCLEKSLVKYPEKAEPIKQLMREYEEKGYAGPLTSEEKRSKSERISYVPIFLVQNPNKPKKVRPVWDFAATTNGISVNSQLLSGPDLTAPLLGVLFRFRERKVAIVGDIREMFHRVMMRPEDQCAQRFLWRYNSKDPIQEYALRVMSFGSTCSPSCAQYVKNTNADEFVEKFPEARNAIIESHYVDDWLDSFDTPSETLRIAKDVKEVHDKGGFEIRNWRSSSRQVAQALGESEVSPTNLQFEDSTEKVLGMWWDCNRDCFTYSLKYNKGNALVLQGKKVPTKRELLQLVMSIYDPLGLIAHYITRLKVLLQETWRSKTGWDEPISAEQYKVLQTCLKLLPLIEKLKIPRCYISEFTDYSDVNTQLHTFVDASECAEAAVSYFRFQRGDKVECQLIASKTHVAPLKLTSIPDLELESAVIGARLANTIKSHHKLKISNQYFWSDSKVTLDRLRWTDLRGKRKWVAFRIAEIQDVTNPADWRYVPTSKNIADVATKWTKIPSLQVTDTWFTAPDFLYRPENEWPNQVSNVPNTNPEIETNDDNELIAVQTEVKPFINVEDFDSWESLRSTVAQAYRFFSPKQNPWSARVVFEKADKYLYKVVQKDAYKEELRALSTYKGVKLNAAMRRSSLYKKSPFIDEDGILRVQGRIDKASCASYNTKKPIILPKYHRITYLIMQHYHQKFKHVFNDVVINEIRQEYMIPGVRQLLNSVKRNCLACQIRSPKIIEPEMASHPTDRLAAYEPPFTYTGVDYMGPFYVTQGRSTVKRWLALFTCLTTRAIHVEVAYKLDADECITCIRSFMCLRGQPRQFRSDRGTNLVAAEKILCQELKTFDHDRIKQEMEKSGKLEWIFNPPGAPQMGGAWESLVRCFKRAFYASLPSRNFNDSVLRACVAESIHMVNSRPLAYLPIDSSESEALTPNHFLLGNSSGVKATGVIHDHDKWTSTGYITAQQFRERLSKRWISEYLPELVCRTKNYEKTDPLAVGDLVIVVDPTLPANTYPKGRIVEVFPSKDGNVRSAKVKTSTGLYHRPISKLAKLRIKNDGEQQAHGSGNVVN